MQVLDVMSHDNNPKRHPAWGFVLVLVLLLVEQVTKALTAPILALEVISTVTAAAEVILSRFDTITVDHAVDEAEVGRNDCFVNIIDDGYGDGAVGVEGA